MPRRHAAADYDSSVFVNCPFDHAYAPLFEAIVFTIIHCGFTVRCALEVVDAGSTRIDKLYKLIENCRFGLHDLSRTEVDEHSQLPRFNMPFELGLFLGAKHYGIARHRTKQSLILDTEQYRYRKFLSDIAGQDVQEHKNDRIKASSAVRDWLAASRSKSDIPLAGGQAIMRHFGEFESFLPAMLIAAQLERSELGFFDLANFMGQFLEERRTMTT